MGRNGERESKGFLKLERSMFIPLVCKLPKPNIRKIKLFAGRRGKRRGMLLQRPVHILWAKRHCVTRFPVLASANRYHRSGALLHS